MKKIFALMFLSALVSCASAALKTDAHVFAYEDFGPQVIANELIGMEWWQWEPHGDSRPRKYDVKVVVYRGISLAKIQTRYPIVAAANQDFRYVSYDDALRYLDQKIEENVIETVTANLKLTKRRLLELFAKR